MPPVPRSSRSSVALFALLFLGCTGGNAERAFCEKESACTATPLDECLEGRKEMAGDDSRCRAQNQAMLRCMTANATCQRAGTMKFLHLGTACKREVDALTSCRSAR